MLPDLCFLLVVLRGGAAQQVPPRFSLPSCCLTWGERGVEGAGFWCLKRALYPGCRPHSAVFLPSANTAAEIQQSVMLGVLLL